MTFKRPNRAKVQTVTTGTSNVALGTVVAGFQSFAAAGMANGDTCRYVIEEGPNWEIGLGTYNSTGPVLERTAVLESSNADAKIVLAGSAVVYAAATGEDWDNFATPKETHLTGVTGPGPHDLGWTPQSKQHLFPVFVNATPQYDFTLSGSTITFDTAVVAVGQVIDVDAYGWQGSGTTALGIVPVDYYWDLVDGQTVYLGANAKNKAGVATPITTSIVSDEALDLFRGAVWLHPTEQFTRSGVDFTLLHTPSASDGKLWLRVRPPLTVADMIPNSLLTTRGDMIRRGAAGPERFDAKAADTFVGGDGTDVVVRTAAQVRSSLGETRSILTKSAAHTAVAADRGRTLIATGTWQLDLTAGATLTDGWWMPIRNAGTGQITIEPNGAELINGLSNLILYPEDSGHLICDGTNFHFLHGAKRFRGARATKSGAQSVANSTDTTIAFDTESYDTDSIHDNVTNNSRLTIPVGVTLVEIGYALSWTSGAAATLRASWITKNGVNIGIGDYRASKYEQKATVKTGPIPVAGGDYFQLLTFQESGGALNVDTSTSFWMEIIR